MALSASPDVPEEVSEKVKQALVNASQTEKGKAMLKAINLEGFEATDKETYAGYAKLLDGMFGY
jgi:ABC-type phosphate/phosphonate transport system substrate-binding protein